MSIGASEQRSNDSMAYDWFHKSVLAPPLLRAAAADLFAWGAYFKGDANGLPLKEEVEAVISVDRKGEARVYAHVPLYSRVDDTLVSAMSFRISPLSRSSCRSKVRHRAHVWKGFAETPPWAVNMNTRDGGLAMLQRLDLEPLPVLVVT